MKNLPIALLIVYAVILYSCNPEPNKPKPQPNTEQQEIKDTAYGSDERHKMDLYLPKDRNQHTPTIILIHGGAWQAGNKSEMNKLIPLIQAEMPEAAIANINYRLANGNTITADQMMDDIAASVQFLSDNSEQLNISNHFAMIGASAGAHLAMLYTYKYNVEDKVKCVSDMFGPAVLDDWEWYNAYNIFLGANIKDILKTYTGTYWDTTIYKSHSPQRQLSVTQQKPTIIFHGNLDPIVPLYQSQWLRAKLTELNIPHQYVEYSDFHGFNDANNKDCIKKTILFFKEHL